MWPNPLFSYSNRNYTLLTPSYAYAWHSIQYPTIRTWIFKSNLGSDTVLVMDDLTSEFEIHWFGSLFWHFDSIIWIMCRLPILISKVNIKHQMILFWIIHCITTYSNIYAYKCNVNGVNNIWSLQQDSNLWDAYSVCYRIHMQSSWQDIFYGHDCVVQLGFPGHKIDTNKLSIYDVLTEHSIFLGVDFASIHEETIRTYQNCENHYYRDASDMAYTNMANQSSFWHVRNHICVSSRPMRLCYQGHRGSRMHAERPCW